MRVAHHGRRLANARPLTTHHSPLTRREAFTLVELLVVIAIIGVLISLLLPAIFKIKERARELEVRHDIGQIQTSIQGFTSKNSIDAIPSRIILREDGLYAADPNSQLYTAEKQSLVYLKRLWPQLVTGLGCLGHDWNGDGVIETPSNVVAGNNGIYILEGDQCLVFFLGGVQVGGACQGFGVNKKYPANINPAFNGTLTGSKSEPPIFEFPTNRLAILGDPLNTGRSPYFRSFLDPFDSPYAYFSSRGGFGCAGADATNPSAGGPKSYQYGYGPVDCAGLLGANGMGKPGTVNGGPPCYYCEGKTGVGLTKAMNRDGFQVICAGKDKTFGSPFQNEFNVTWNPATGQRSHDYEQPGVSAGNGGKPPYADVGPAEAHADDFSNFHQSALGIGTQ